MVQTLKNWVSNQLLVLYAINRANDLTVTRLHKTAFLSQRKSYKTKKSTFNYQFTRMPQGPWSSELKQDLDGLSKSNLLSEEKYKKKDAKLYHITYEGENLLYEFSEVIERNQSHIKTIDSQVEKIKEMEYQEMLDYVYSLKNPVNPRITIANSPRNRYVLRREIQPHDYQELDLTKEEIATLEIHFTPGYYDELKEIEENDISDLSPYQFG